MTEALIVLKQIAVMFILMFIGFFLFKGKKLDQKGTKSISNLLVYILIPAVVINGFLTEPTPEKMKELLISAALALVSLAIAIFLSHVFFKKNGIENFASSFSNPGFFGVPIITALFSGSAVFSVTAFIAFLNIGQWTYGVSLLKEEKMKWNWKTILLSPFIISMFLGLCIFFLSIPVPQVFRTTVTTLASANTPVAMMLLGTYLAQTDIKDIFINPRLYMVSAARLVLIPLVTLAVLLFVPASYHEARMCILIASACPVGANVAVYAQIHNKDYAYSVETVTQSTILSAVTIPLILMLADKLWSLPIFGG